ncbi:hypothetical protein HBB16_13335 [Pseudonocardia sp. MCCB 268]|nr:hypothetical protein [Pseudonocardia cytotoxica]
MRIRFRARSVPRRRRGGPAPLAAACRRGILVVVPEPVSTPDRARPRRSGPGLVQAGGGAGAESAV